MSCKKNGCSCVTESCLSVWRCVNVLLSCVCCLSYLVEAHTSGAGDPGEGGVASSFSSNEQGRYTSVLLPGLDADTHTHTHTHTHTYIYKCTETHAEKHTGRILTTTGELPFLTNLTLSTLHTQVCTHRDTHTQALLVFLTLNMSWFQQFSG